MRHFMTCVVAGLGAIAFSGGALAAPAHLTDVQFMTASRCAALIASPALGGGDVSAINALLKDQERGRMQYIADKADQLRSDAERESRHADAAHKAKLIAERDGVCQTFNRGGVNSASVGGATPSPSAP
jgi:hypothetical protein